ncbi:MAG: site-specific integrase [Phycisphaerae bacterium]|nr:site-specific integrase [Phycisphaerae bacterium]
MKRDFAELENVDLSAYIEGLMDLLFDPQDAHSGITVDSFDCLKDTFHDIRRTAITMWFANGMSEHDVMVLAGHASFAATHESYLAVADDLISRARAATAQGLRQLVHFGTPRI